MRDCRRVGFLRPRSVRSFLLSRWMPLHKKKQPMASSSKFQKGSMLLFMLWFLMATLPASATAFISTTRNGVTPAVAHPDKAAIVAQCCCLLCCAHQRRVLSSFEVVVERVSGKKRALEILQILGNHSRISPSKQLLFMTGGEEEEQQEAKKNNANGGDGNTATVLTESEEEVINRLMPHHDDEHDRLSPPPPVYFVALHNGAARREHQDRSSVPPEDLRADEQRSGVVAGVASAHLGTTDSLVANVRVIDDDDGDDRMTVMRPPPSRGDAIATALLRAVERCALLECHVHRIVLMVENDNNDNIDESAIRFYQRAGYDFVGFSSQNEPNDDDERTTNANQGGRSVMVKKIQWHVIQGGG